MGEGGAWRCWDIWKRHFLPLEIALYNHKVHSNEKSDVYNNGLGGKSNSRNEISLYW